MSLLYFGRFTHGLYRTVVPKERGDIGADDVLQDMSPRQLAGAVYVINRAYPAYYLQ